MAVSRLRSHHAPPATIMPGRVCRSKISKIVRRRAAFGALLRCRVVRTSRRHRRDTENKAQRSRGSSTTCQHSMGVTGMLTPRGSLQMHRPPSSGHFNQLSHFNSPLKPIGLSGNSLQRNRSGLTSSRLHLHSMQRYMQRPWRPACGLRWSCGVRTCSGACWSWTPAAGWRGWTHTTRWAGRVSVVGCEQGAYMGEKGNGCD